MKDSYNEYCMPTTYLHATIYILLFSPYHKSTHPSSPPSPRVIFVMLHSKSQTY